jgi:adenosylcobinamide-phosphate synthase
LLHEARTADYVGRQDSRNSALHVFFGHRNTNVFEDQEARDCVDAVTASLFWATLGGAPAVLAHRAINTLDAMVGHHGERYEHFGWASARLDDLVNYIPARLTALAVVAARPRSAIRIGRVVRRDAPRHPSPNGGVVEAAFAAALGVTPGGVNRYGDDVEDRGTLGDGRCRHRPTSPELFACVARRRDVALVILQPSMAVVSSRQAAEKNIHPFSRRASVRMRTIRRRRRRAPAIRISSE